MSIDWNDHVELKIIQEKLRERFEFREYLGGGGFGKVFRITDRHLDRECALKVLNFRRLDKCDDNERKEINARFLKEARAYARCKHSNIVTIYDIDNEASFPFIIMDYINGKNLKQLIFEKCKLNFNEILNISMAILPALGYIHKCGLVHRDLKAGNIMIESGTGRAIIIDFGIVKDLVSATLTRSDIIIGSPPYMAPEQWQSSKEVDSRADIYSFGVLLYEMVTGEFPFQGTPVEMMEKHLKDPVPDAGKINPAASPGIQKIIKKAMSKKPRDRFKTVTELLNGLKKLI